MRLLLYFLLLIPISSCWQMIEFWGIPLENSDEVISTDIWKECRDKCYEENSCVAVVQLDATENCQIYRFGQLSSVEIVDSSSKGKRISIKKNINECPATLADMLNKITSDETELKGNLAYNYNMTLSKTYEQKFWNIHVEYFIECPEGSVVYRRGANRVCITVRLFPDASPCQNQTMGADLCTQPGDSRLTGPYSFDEGKAIAYGLSQKCSSSHNHCNFWIDGNRFNSTDFEVKDPTLNGTTGYVWDVAPSKSEEIRKCVFLATMGTVSGIVYVHECQITDGGAYGYCQRGAICRTDPVYQYSVYN